MAGARAFAPFVGRPTTWATSACPCRRCWGQTVAEVRTGYTADLDAGTVTFTDLTGYPAQVSVIGRTEVYRQIAEVRIDGRVKLTQPIGYAFPAGAIFSTALRFGDRFAQVSRVYDQASWSGTTWIDGVDPAAGEATATYNTKDHPVEVNNRGAITERWALRIKNGGTTFDLIGKNLGQMATGSINEDFSPMNVSAGVPYMTLRAAGWGAGWAPGNTLFIDTVGAEAPIDVGAAPSRGTPRGGAGQLLDRPARRERGRPPESGFKHGLPGLRFPQRHAAAHPCSTVCAARALRCLDACLNTGFGQVTANLCHRVGRHRHRIAAAWARLLAARQHTGGRRHPCRTEWDFARHRGHRDLDQAPDHGARRSRHRDHHDQGGGGWMDQPFSAANKAVFRSANVQGSRHYFRFDETATNTLMRVRATRR